MKQPPSPLTMSTQAHSPKRGENKPQGLLSEGYAGVDRRIMWIDGVGGFLLIDKNEVIIGQATSGNPVDVGIVGDLSRQSCAFLRSDGDYLLQPLQETHVDGRLIDRPQLLGNAADIQLGNRVRLQFSKPNPLSGTARLDLKSLHHFKPHVDGVLLLAQSCILGPSPASHIVCPTWPTELLLFRHADQWHFRSLEVVEVNGKTCQGQIPMTPGMRLRGEDFSLSIE